MKVDNKYLQRLGVLPYEDTRPRARTRARDLEFRLETRRTEAPTRRLRGQWTMEVEEDLRAVHGLDAEQHLIDVLTQSINEQEGVLGEANRALDELVEQAQERGEYDIEQEGSTSALNAFRAWIQAARGL